MATKPKQRAMNRRRMNISGVRVMTIAITLVALILLASLFKIQILEHDEIVESATSQYYRSTFYAPARGDIYDRDGVKIAGSSYVYRVGITPRHLMSRDDLVGSEEIQEKLVEILGLDPEELADQVKQTDSDYIQLAKNVPEEEGKALETYIKDMKLGGIRLDAEPKRYYLNGNLASQVVGYASNDGEMMRGIFGLENDLDEVLRGEPGFNYAARDNYLSHGLLPYSQSESKEGKNGSDVYLTLDMNVQKIVQEDLEAAIKAYDAVEDGMAVCMNPYTGEIYAMASYPYFRSEDPFAAPSGVKEEDWDPNNQQALGKAWRNKVVADLYEAGSTMKAITAAIGLEEGVTNETNTYFDDPIYVMGSKISCWTKVGHGVETLEQAFWNSCNPVFVQVADAIGIDTFYKYMRAFGFQEPTGIELSGWTNNIFHSNPSRLDMANLSFGESSSVSPLHLARAYCALLNGGKLVTPHVVREVVDVDGRMSKPTGSNVERRVISASTSARVRNLLKGMVEASSGYTNTWGYSMGGKTSTSTDEVTGKNTVSFLAAAPIDHPEVMLLMILQRPSSEEVGGGEAQVVTQNCMQKILNELNIDRAYDDIDVVKMYEAVEAPDAIGMKVEEIARKSTFKQIHVVPGDEETKGDSKIAMQTPAPGTLLYPGMNIFVYSTEKELEAVTIPDLSEMNYNEVINACNQLGLVPQFEGVMDGRCVGQRIANEGALPEGSSGKVGELANRGQVIRVAME